MCVPLRDSDGAQGFGSLRRRCEDRPLRAARRGRAVTHGGGLVRVWISPPLPDMDPHAPAAAPTQRHPGPRPPDRQGPWAARGVCPATPSGPRRGDPAPPGCQIIISFNVQCTPYFAVLKKQNQFSFNSNTHPHLPKHTNKRRCPRPKGGCPTLPTKGGESVLSAPLIEWNIVINRCQNAGPPKTEP